ncbi:hypothetical protein [Candidatus Bartonella washoeensis]|uniref:hypothetical protein n=1 Tax=Candidatus Bartonella washoeensis TaxID=186739 RepID=UPI000557983C|nr:hypothetical protein [Bartonella washoeensis]
MNNSIKGKSIGSYFTKAHEIRSLRMTAPQKYAGKKSLMAAFIRLLTRSSTLCKNPQSNQAFHDDHTPPVHIFNSHQGAIKYNFLKSKTRENISICENNKQWWKIHQRGFAKAHAKRTQNTFKKEMCIKTIQMNHFASLIPKELQNRHQKVKSAISTHDFEGNPSY